MLEYITAVTGPLYNKLKKNQSAVAMKGTGNITI
jgi:hypothetical protein